MKKKSIGIIGAGKHFSEKIFPIIFNSSFFKINGILRKNKKPFKKIPILTEKVFFKQPFDFVYICCPNNYHEEYIIKSLNSNYNVICEKPFIIRNKNLNKILNLASFKNKLIFECFMYSYHPVFKYVKNIIESKRYGKINYVISNFRYPTLKKNDNRYKENEGKGFYNDAASYLISLESYLFNNTSFNFKSITKKIKKKIDLRGYIFLEKGKETRHYFWGEGQNYSNNLEIFFDGATIHIDKFFSKAKNEHITLKIYSQNSKIIKFKPVDQFKLMFDKISKNYQKTKFKLLNYSLIKNQSNLLNKLNK